MPNYATILIPDISGYTEFFSRTDLEFGTAVLCELLNELMSVASNQFRVAEIEGDAILFYSKDQRIKTEELVAYCLRAYLHFHTYLKNIIERVADEEARKAAEVLTVKFIAHWGPIAEINIGNFYKPVGLTLIKAHKLLKNRINSRSYILFTQEFAEGQPLPQHHVLWPKPLLWHTGEENYDGIGNTVYKYALLEPEIIAEGDLHTSEHPG